MPATAAATPGVKLLYKVPEVAPQLGIGLSKMWELVGRGEIESVLIDGARRIPHDAITAYIAKLRAGDR